MKIAERMQKIVGEQEEMVADEEPLDTGDKDFLGLLADRVAVALMAQMPEDPVEAAELTADILRDLAKKKAVLTKAYRMMGRTGKAAAAVRALKKEV